MSGCGHASSWWIDDGVPYCTCGALLVRCVGLDEATELMANKPPEPADQEAVQVPMTD